MFQNRLARVIAGLTGTIGSIGAIVGILTKVFDWDIRATTAVVSVLLLAVFVLGYLIDRMISKVNANLNASLEEIKITIHENEAKAKERDLIQEKATCRLELALLMDTQAKNRLAIEKKARHYFCELGGNDWMGEYYSAWAEKNGGDVSILLCDKKLLEENNNENRGLKIRR